MVPFYFCGDQCIAAESLHWFQEQRLVGVRLQEMTSYNLKNLKVYFKILGGPN